MNNKYSKESTEDLQKRLRKLQEETINIEEEITRRTNKQLRHLEKQINELSIREAEISTHLSSQADILRNQLKLAGKEGYGTGSSESSKYDTGSSESSEYASASESSEQIKKDRVTNKVQIKAQGKKTEIKVEGENFNPGWTLKRIELKSSPKPVLLHILNTPIKAKNSFHFNRRESSRRLIKFGVTTGKLDSKGTEIVSGTKVTLATPSTRNSPFYNTSQAIVIGTSHHNRRIWLGHIDNLDIRTDREAKNIIAPRFIRD